MSRTGQAFALLLTLGLAAISGSHAKQPYIPQPEEVLLGDFEGLTAKTRHSEHRRLREKTHPHEPVVCGNSTSAFTISFGGTHNDTICTASAGLSDDGKVTCQAFGKAFGVDCDIYLGSLNLNIGLMDPSGTYEPDVQSGLAVLGLNNLSEVGLLHVTVGGTGQSALAAINFLPSLQAIIGAVNPNPSNGFTGAALYISGSTNGITGEQDISSLPSLSRLRDINGTTIIQGTALVNLTSGLQELSVVEGDFVIQNNNNLASLSGTAQSLEFVSGQVYIANNPVLELLAGVGEGALTSVGSQLVIGNNPLLQSLQGLENLKSIGGPLTVSQNTALSNITALYNYAKCATKPTSEVTPVPIFVEVILEVQEGAPPITCILNTFPAICAYIDGVGCPNAAGQPVNIGGGTNNGD